MKKVKRLSKKPQTTTKTHRHREQYGDYQRERGGDVEEGRGGINGAQRRLDFGW